MEVLREDPDLKPIFDDIASSGTAGMERHWNDVELMSKISRKMGEMGLTPAPAPQPPGKTLPVRFCGICAGMVSAMQCARWFSRQPIPAAARQNLPASRAGAANLPKPCGICWRQFKQ
jgi:hypothetical protein